MTDIKNFEGLYAITEDGRVWSYRSKKYLKPQIIAGYPTVDLHSNTDIQRVYIHRMVADAYIPNPTNLPEVNHKDEDKTNNSVSNLEWCTHQYNSQYSVHKRQTSVFCVELNQVFSGVTLASRELGIAQSSISFCLTGRYNTAGGYHWRYV